MYLVNHPDYVREILVANQGNFTKSRALQRAKILLGEGLLTSEGEHHLRQRRLVQPAFHRERLAGYASAMSKCAVRARERWQAGSAMDVSVEMAQLTLSVVAKTLFSTDIESEAPEIGAAMTSILQLFKFLLLPFSEYLDKLPLPYVRRFEKARARLDATIYGLIRERRKSGQDTGDLLSMLLLSQDEDDRTVRMSDEQVRDEALTLFLAGTRRAQTRSPGPGICCRNIPRWSSACMPRSIMCSKAARPSWLTFPSCATPKWFFPRRCDCIRRPGRLAGGRRTSSHSASSRYRPLQSVS